METTATSVEDKPNDSLARLEGDHGILALGVIPVIVIGALFVVIAITYFVRRRRNWNELGDAMRIDDGDKPIGVSGGERAFIERAKDLDSTRPTEKL